jgi:hypothetical protein
VADAGLSPQPANATEQGVDLPSVPPNFQVLVLSPLSILVNWSTPIDTGLGPSVVPPRNLTNYRVEQLSLSSAAAEPYDFSAASSRVLGGQTTLLSVTALIKGYFYYFRVRAQNSAGIGNWTAVLYERGVDLPFPVQGLVSACIKPFTINVTWVAPSDTGLGAWQPSRLFSADGYLLELSLTATFTATTPLYIAGNETTWILTGLVKGQRYFFRIRSRNSAGPAPTPRIILPTAGCRAPLPRPQPCHPLH